MAQCTQFTCDRCGFSVAWWDDGNRYPEWPAGIRNYLYHPADISETERIMNVTYGRSLTRDEYERAFEPSYARLTPSYEGHTLYGGNESG